MDASILEKEKENIKPLMFGRSALKLGKALVETRAPTVLSKQRDKFEIDLLSEELDDPLQVYIDYIAWTHNHYPQGANSESGLLNLLERCTSCFRDTLLYKNDPRYMKIWLEYAEYSDSPRDIFVYLAKKNIGQELALFYGLFASFLEAKGLKADAREVYEIGIERNAWPVKRLQRSYRNFMDRNENIISPASTDIRALIAPKRPLASTVWSDSGQSSKKQNLTIHHDDSPATLRETVFTPNPSARLNLKALTSKENRLTAKPWAGEVLKQSEENIDREKKPAKFEVFRDEIVETKDDFVLREENKQMFTIVNQPGKPREKICVNMKLLYPSADEEFCLGEILARSYMANKVETKNQSIEKPARYRETEQTFTIPLRDDTTQRPKSPTITMMSRMATNEVLGMFNDAAHNLNLDDEIAKDFEDSTNYDGFHTETINVDSQDMGNQLSDRIATPPTDHYDTDGGSSPFLERP